MVNIMKISPASLHLPCCACYHTHHRFELPTDVRRSRSWVAQSPEPERRREEVVDRVSWDL